MYLNETSPFCAAWAFDSGLSSVQECHDSSCKMSDSNQIRHQLWVASMAMFAAAALLHALQLAGLLRHHFSTAQIGVWPHPFHFWVLESALLIGGVACLALRDRWTKLEAWWQVSTPTKQAASLVAPLFAVQLMIGLGFWATRNQTVDDLGWLRAFFWLSAEYRPPAFFAASQLWLAAWLSWQIWRIEKRSPWLAAAMVCLYMGCDESLVINERVGHHIADIANAPLFEGIYNWLVFFAPLALALGMRFAWQFQKILDGLSMGLLVLAGAVFLSGAVGMELFEAAGRKLDERFLATPAGHLNMLIEEMLELFGVGLTVWLTRRSR